MLRSTLCKQQALRSTCKLFSGTCVQLRRASSASPLLQQHSRRWLCVRARHAPMPFSLQPPLRRLKFPWESRLLTARPGDMQVEVDMLQEGSPQGITHAEVEALLNSLEPDCQRVVQLALAAKLRHNPEYRPPQVANISLVLSDDAYIQQLNANTRGKDEPTDVLSFEMPDEEGMYLPIKMLGDVVISLDTATRQAQERGHTLLDEVRILLVHGVLHVAGFDHEQGQQQQDDMAAEEQAIMGAMGWKGEGLISSSVAAAGQEADVGASPPQPPPAASSSSSISHSTAPKGPKHKQQQQLDATASDTSSSSSNSSTSTHQAKRRRQGQVRLVALDMDGTLLNSSSKIPKEAAAAIRAACAAGTRVMIATGKARPGALSAVRAAGLEGDQLLLSPLTPGVFLQGLAVHGHGGKQLTDAALPRPVVAQAFSWAAAAGVSCVAFLGDECSTLELTPQLEELHHTYYEPLAQQLSDLSALLAGPPVKKLLFMADPLQVEEQIKPHWLGAVAGSGAEVLQAVPNMLEVVPVGVNKWAGLQVLLDHLAVPVEAFMAVGDGSNDLQMVANAGIGVAMGNAVPSVAAVADAVVATNDEGGIAEAFERFVL